MEEEWTGSLRGDPVQKKGCFRPDGDHVTRSRVRAAWLDVPQRSENMLEWKDSRNSRILFREQNRKRKKWSETNQLMGPLVDV